MAVTAIKAATNNYDADVIVIGHENPDTSGNTVTISAGATISSSDINIWIPWAVSQTDLDNNHYISVEFTDTGKFYYVWQYLNFVRMSDSLSWDQYRAAVPNVCSVGGDRLLTICADGCPSLSVMS